MIVIKLVLFLIAMIMIPVGIGRLWNKNLFFSLLMGYVFMMALYQIMAVPSILLKLPFHILNSAYWGVCLLTAVGSVIYLIKNRKRSEGCTRANREVGSFCWYGAVLLIVLQCFFVVANDNSNADDARYVASAVEAYESDTMLLNNPATGEALGGWVNEIEKDVTSPWCIFYASIAWVTRIHPAIIMHTCMPLFWVAFHYFIYHLIASELFGLSRKREGLFLFLLAIFNMLGIQSESVNSFLLLRVWQGKAIVVSVVIPLLFYVLGRIMKDEWKNRSNWLLLFGTMLMGCLCSGVGIFLDLLLVGCGILIIVCYKKEWRYIPFAMLACVPNIIFGLMYAMIR